MAPLHDAKGLALGAGPTRGHADAQRTDGRAGAHEQPAPGDRVSKTHAVSSGISARHGSRCRAVSSLEPMELELQPEVGRYPSFLVGRSSQKQLSRKAMRSLDDAQVASCAKANSLSIEGRSWFLAPAGYFQSASEVRAASLLRSSDPVCLDLDPWRQRSETKKERHEASPESAVLLRTIAARRPLEYR
jgi:hypothetical protein